MRLHFLRLATVAVFAAGSLLAQAPSPNPQLGGGGPRQGLRGIALHRLGKISRSLNLTDTQKQQAKALFQQARQTAQPLRQQLQQNRQNLEDAAKAGKTDTDIQQLAAQQGALQGRIVAIRYLTWTRFLNLLTPDQRAQLDQLK